VHHRGAPALLIGKEHILFVCTANRDRSPTAEALYSTDPRYEVRSAGVAEFATNPVTADLLLWADRIFVMCERLDRHHTQIRMRFPAISRPTVDLDIEDRWPRDHPELIKRLRRKLQVYLGEPQS
jgi:predicted protein tyrosine phosphatase